MSGMEFIDNPYKTAEIADVAHSPVDEMYYLCVDAEGKFALEIIKGAELVKPFYEKKCYRVIGVAGGRKAAFLLVRRVVEDFIATGNGFDTFGDYLLRFEGEQNVY